MPVEKINQFDLFYTEHGNGLPCLVMHGGLGMDHTYLHPWLDPLGDVLHLVYYDHRCNGRSSCPCIDTLTFPQLCADANALRECLGFSTIVLMGHSYGGFISLEYALRYPETLSHLILVDTSPAFKHDREVIANAKRKGATKEMMAALHSQSPVFDQQFQDSFQVILPLYFSRYDDELARCMFERTKWSALAGIRSNQLLARYDVTQRLCEINVPTLIIAGRDDFICPPSQADIIHRCIPNSELVILDQSGHFPYAEEPGAFFDAVRKWLKSSTCST